MSATAKAGVEDLSVNTKIFTLKDVLSGEFLAGELCDGIIPGLQCRDKRWHSTNEKRVMVMLLYIAQSIVLPHHCIYDHRYYPNSYKSDNFSTGN